MASVEGDGEGSSIRPFKPAQKTGVVVANTLRDRIVGGELSQGDRLPPEDELMAEFGLARTTVREGLRILESQGLIEIVRGRSGGGRVTRPDIGHLAETLAVMLQLEQVTYRDLQEAAEALEPTLAATLAERATDLDIAALNALCNRAGAAAKADDPVAFGEAAAAFHEEVMKRAGNRTLATLARLLGELRRGYYTWAGQQGADQKTFERAVRSYRKLVRLIEAGDGEAAREHWRKQLEYTPRHTRKSMDDPVTFF
jgi:GntR family transcriptional repressor for pyruvate dehydrogenase complex